MTSGINQRFRQLREELNKTQNEWADIMGLSRSGITAIESGQRNVTEKHIKLLCVEPIDGKYVNETWLRTGEGEMFLTLSKKDELMLWASTALSDESETFRNKFVDMLSKLDVNDWELLANMAETLVKQRAKDKTP